MRDLVEEFAENERRYRRALGGVVRKYHLDPSGNMAESVSDRPDHGWVDRRSLAAENKPRWRK